METVYTPPLTVSAAGDSTLARPEPPDRVTSTVYSPSSSKKSAALVPRASKKASAGRESARNSSVLSYHFSFFRLNAAQATPVSSASTGRVKLPTPSSASTRGI